MFFINLSKSLEKINFSNTFPFSKAETNYINKNKYGNVYVKTLDGNLFEVFRNGKLETWEVEKLGNSIKGNLVYLDLNLNW